MKRLIMFHGTSSVFLPKILERGLLPVPETRLSGLMADSPDSHTVSFSGTYFTADLDGAGGYARHAAQHFGGEPTILTVLVDPSVLVPDEDEVNYALGWPLTEALGYLEDADEIGHLQPWTEAAALHAATSLAMVFGLGENFRHIDSIAKCLHSMLEPVLRCGDWDGHPRLVCPDYNTEGWGSPAWARALAATPGGLSHYRTSMDTLTRQLAGIDPDDYPAGLESCKGRILTAIMPDDETGPCILLGAGPLTDPLGIHDWMDRARACDEVDGYDRAIDLLAPRPCPVRATA